MPRKNITPTKSNFNLLKGELKLAKEGHGLLEQKREVLIAHLNNLVVIIREKRSSLDKYLLNIYTQLSLVRLETDGFNLEMIVNSAKQDYEVEIIPHSVMGVVVPKLVFLKIELENKSLVPMGISGTSPAFDKLLKFTNEIQSLMAEVAYLESTAWKLAGEIKKTQRRINALENFIIPDTEETMKFIKNILEEKDRETLFQIKRVKEKHHKKKICKKGANS